MSRAWMPIYWGDYLKDTRDLTTLQHGAYLLLIAHYWQHGGLPSGDAQLAQIAGLSKSQWKKNRPVIEKKFKQAWTHPRIESELAKANKLLHQRALAGQKGGLKSAAARAVAIGKSLALGEAIGRAQAPALAARNAQAIASAKRERPAANHNHQRVIEEGNGKEAGSAAARALAPAPCGDALARAPSAEAAAEQPKRPAEMSRAELDEVFARRSKHSTSS